MEFLLILICRSSCSYICFLLFLQNKKSTNLLVLFFVLPQTTYLETMYLNSQYRSLIPFQFLLRIADSNEFVLLKIDSTPQFSIQHLIQYLPFSLLTTVQFHLIRYASIDNSVINRSNSTGGKVVFSSNTYKPK